MTVSVSVPPPCFFTCFFRAPTYLPPLPRLPASHHASLFAPGPHLISVPLWLLRSITTTPQCLD
jgi:hypothetical protein